VRPPLHRSHRANASWNRAGWHFRRSLRRTALGLLASAWVVSCGAQTSSTGSDSGVTVDVDDSSTKLDSAPPCRVDTDCVQPAGAFCQECYIGGPACAASRCIDSRCKDVPGWCDGPLTAPCGRKQCGDDCQHCLTEDGGCYDGKCNWLGVCKSEGVDCSGDAGTSCAPNDAIAIGDCNVVLGFAWDGRACSPLVGCTCRGSECIIMKNSEFECIAVYRRCITDR
jgi:hypothetical protein